VNDFFVLNLEAALVYTFDFSDEVVQPAVLTSVTFSQEGSGLTLSNQLDDLPNNRSSIRIANAEHGYTYTVQAVGVTSLGESIVKDITLRGFNA
jgi:hypothetical protein